MKIKITKCDYKEFWYADCVGKIFTVYVTNWYDRQHIVTNRFFAFTNDAVDFGDCEILNENIGN